MLHLAAYERRTRPLIGLRGEAMNPTALLAAGVTLVYCTALLVGALNPALTWMPPPECAGCWNPWTDPDGPFSVFRVLSDSALITLLLWGMLIPIVLVPAYCWWCERIHRRSWRWNTPTGGALAGALFAFLFALLAGWWTALDGLQRPDFPIMSIVGTSFLYWTAIAPGAIIPWAAWATEGTSRFREGKATTRLTIGLALAGLIGMGVAATITARTSFGEFMMFFFLAFSLLFNGIGVGVILGIWSVWRWRVSRWYPWPHIMPSAIRSQGPEPLVRTTSSYRLGFLVQRPVRPFQRKARFATAISLLAVLAGLTAVGSLTAPWWEVTQEAELDVPSRYVARVNATVEVRYLGHGYEMESQLFDWRWGVPRSGYQVEADAVLGTRYLLILVEISVLAGAGVLFAMPLALLLHRRGRLPESALPTLALLGLLLLALGPILFQALLPVTGYGPVDNAAASVDLVNQLCASDRADTRATLASGVNGRANLRSYILTDFDPIANDYEREPGWCRIAWGPGTGFGMAAGAALLSLLLAVLTAAVRAPLPADQRGRITPLDSDFVPGPGVLLPEVAPGVRSPAPPVFAGAPPVLAAVQPHPGTTRAAGVHPGGHRGPARVHPRPRDPAPTIVGAPGVGAVPGAAPSLPRAVAVAPLPMVTTGVAPKKRGKLMAVLEGTPPEQAGPIKAAPLNRQFSEKTALDDPPPAYGYEFPDDDSP